MLDRLHHVVAKCCDQEELQWNQAKYAKFIGNALGSRVISVALVAMQTVTLLFSPFVIAAKMGIYSLKNRAKPLYEDHYARYLQANIAAVKMVSLGIIFSLLSTIASEVVYNKFKLQKTLYNYSNQSRIGASDLPEKDLQQWNQIAKKLKVPCESTEETKKYLQTIYSKWEANVVKANDKETIGCPYVNKHFKASVLEARKNYVEETLGKIVFEKAKTFYANELEKLSKITSRNDQEEELYQLLKALLPKEIAKGKTDGKTAAAIKSDAKQPDSKKAETPSIDLDRQLAEKLDKEEREAQAKNRRASSTNWDALLAQQLQNADGPVPANRAGNNQRANPNGGNQPQYAHLAVSPAAQRNIGSIVANFLQQDGKNNNAVPVIANGIVAPSGSSRSAHAKVQADKKVQSENAAPVTTKDRFTNKLVECMEESAKELLELHFFDDIKKKRATVLAVNKFSIYKLFSPQKQGAGKGIIPVWSPEKDPEDKIKKTQNELKTKIQEMEQYRDMEAIGLMQKLLTNRIDTDYFSDMFSKVKKEDGFSTAKDEEIQREVEIRTRNEIVKQLSDYRTKSEQNEKIAKLIEEINIRITILERPITEHILLKNVAILNKKVYS